MHFHDTEAYRLIKAHATADGLSLRPLIGAVAQHAGVEKLRRSAHWRTKVTDEEAAKMLAEARKL